MKSLILGPCFENSQNTDCTGVCRPNQGFSTRQVEGLQRVDVLQRKLTFRFPHFSLSPFLGSGAWRFQRDLGGMKSPILGPGFGNGQDT
ncbi:unnamed protein product, partial [Staurois parvus]